MDPAASTSRTATGPSVSWSGVRWPKRLTSPAIGMIENPMKAVDPAMIGARLYMKVSALAGVNVSFHTSLKPSARVWKMPPGPNRLGPGRCCRKPTMRRSNQITTTTLSIR